MTLQTRVAGVPIEIRTTIDHTRTPARQFVGEIMPDEHPLDRPFEFRSTYVSGSSFSVLAAIVATILGEVEMDDKVAPILNW